MGLAGVRRVKKVRTTVSRRSEAAHDGVMIVGWRVSSSMEMTLAWVDWYNNRHLLERLGHIPPAEAEKAYYASIG